MLPAAALPFVCLANELGALVLLPISAWRVVLAGGIAPVGVCAPPQAARKIVRQRDEAAIKRQGRVLLFTGNDSGEIELNQDY